jgi:putative ABC transport system substrate-binding protein
MKRRAFITLLGSAAATWPLATRAQQAARIRRVGVLMGGSESDAWGRQELAAFQESLQKLGWAEGRNIEFHIRFAGADGERRGAYAAEIVSRAPDVIVANTGPVARALQRETTMIPIVYASGGDIVSGGVISNLARPEGNITGFPVTEPSLGGKWLELLKEFVPGATRVAIMEAPENQGNARYWSAAQGAAQGRILTMIEARDDAQIARDVDEFAQTADGALLVLPGASTILHRDAIVATAARHHLPAIYPFRHFAEAGGLMSYGADEIDLFRGAAGYVDRILRGETPSNLPVQLPTKFELVINLKTAKALGLTVPQSLLVAANEVIE